MNIINLQYETETSEILQVEQHLSSEQHLS